ncbi:hypothetical protein [Cesiribacter andamanensis]|uniref:hypothetical protein n=1 Tax=Cesiribacter andamanensis TaxID=649507 RepID=UPI00034A1FF9|nr:hypothetical protein [Cesiribacter andamanensis]
MAQQDHKAIDYSDSLRTSGEEQISAVRLRSDTLVLKVQYQLDSVNGILSSIQHTLDSLQLDLGNQATHLQDSLQKLQQQGQRFAAALKEKQQSLSAPLAGVQIRLHQLWLPRDGLPEATLPLFSAQSLSLDGVTSQGLFSINLPSLPSETKLNIPQIGTPGNALTYTIPSPELSLPSASRLSSIRELAKLDTGAFDVATLDKNLEDKLLQHGQVKELQQQVDQAQDPLKEYLQQDARQVAEQQALEQADLLQDQAVDKPAHAVDHFAGNKASLDQTRQQLNQYKGRYSEIKSVKELPKSPLKRHPLAGQRWHKRLQPGLQWQLGRAEAFRIDLGPRISYRLTDQIELGASAQRRVSVGKQVPGFVSGRYEQVWGYSIFAGFDYKKEIYGQVSWEQLNVQPQQLPHQLERPLQRIWIDGLRLGLGKRYTLFKQLRGYSLMEYNFTRSLHAPYRQQLQLKMGVLWQR